MQVGSLGSLVLCSNLLLPLVNSMKSFARLFFAIGAALTAHLYLFPDTLKIVCIPGSPAPMAISAQHTSQKTAQPDNASSPVVSDCNLVL